MGVWDGGVEVIPWVGVGKMEAEGEEAEKGDGDDRISAKPSFKFTCIFCDYC